MQTIRRLVTEAEVQRRTFLDISEIILFVSVIFRNPFIRILQHNFFVISAYKKSIFLGNVLERQGMRAL